MYQFFDTTKYTGKVTTELPAEAMSFNGEYLENRIDGYRTLYVRGRESMLAEINAYETGVRDGTGITSKRFPARELVIGYLLRAETSGAFREAYNTLNGILNTQDAQIIFHDEDDKYYTGTPEGLDEIESGRNFVQGEILIYCADPFKYSTKEQAVDVKESTNKDGIYQSLTYAGTYKSYPRLEANFPTSTANGSPDCGYIAWSFYESDYSNYGTAIALGNLNETDEGEFYKTETLFSQDFINGSFGKGNMGDWSYNAVDLHVNINSWGYTGGVFYEPADCLTPETFTREDSKYWWSGMNVSRLIPKASDGAKPQKNWKVTWKQKLSIGTGYGANTTMGGLQVIVTNSSNQVIAAANMYRTTNNADYKGSVSVHTLNTKATKSSINLKSDNPYWGGSGGTCTMTKEGSKVSFNLGGISLSLTDSSIETMTADRVTVVFLKEYGYPHLYEGLVSLSFQNSNVSYWKDVSNTFGKSDDVVVDCNSGTIKINGREDASLGVINNDWEGFCFYPGTQKIRFSWSTWCKNPPNSKIYYREVFI